MSEDSRRFSRKKTRRCFDDTLSNLSTIKETNLISVKSLISSHVRVHTYHIFICEDLVSVLSIAYHSVYHWLLYNKLRIVNCFAKNITCRWKQVVILKENRRPQGIIFEMIWNCRKNVNYKVSIEKSSYFSANQRENYENSPELNIRHFVSILFRLLPNKDCWPPSCDVKALMFACCSPPCFVLVFSLFISRD